MIDLQKKWLNAVPWDSLVNINQVLCRDKQLEHGQNPKTYETTRLLWERNVSKTMTLKEILEICRKCHDLAPFTFNNGNTFSTVGKTLVEDLARCLPPVEAQIVRTTVGHYVVGLIQKGELLQIMRHFEAKWKPAAMPAVPQTPLATPQAQPQVS